MYLLHMLMACNYGFFMIKHFFFFCSFQTPRKTYSAQKDETLKCFINFHGEGAHKRPKPESEKREAKEDEMENRSSFKLNRSFIIISSFHAECFFGFNTM